MKKLATSILAFIITTGLMFHFYGSIFKNPNQFLFAADGDGIKNYYTYAYHISNDADGIHSTSMNYPYGESIFFLDGNPVLAKLYKKFGNPDKKSNDFIAWYNLLMLTSIPLMALFIFLLGVELKMNYYAALLAAIGLAMANPTLLRMTGHFSLSLSFLVPAGMWLTLNWWNRKNPLSLLVLVIFTGIGFFIHPYLGLIVAAFTLASCLLVAWKNRKARGVLVTQVLPLAASVVVPLLVFYLTTSLTDTHPGRTNNPYGFLVFKAYLIELVLPCLGPTRDFLGKLFDLPGPRWESLSYLGLSVIALWLFFLISKRKKILDQLSDRAKLLWGSSFLVYLYAAGVPFVFGLEFLGDWIPIIKSFRATARLVWPFYFAMGLLAFYLVDRRTWNKYLKIGIQCAACLILLWESAAFHQYLNYKFQQEPNQFQFSLLKPELKAIIEENQDEPIDVIYPFHFFSHGSDNFVIEDHHAAKQASMVVSYHLGKPMAAIAAARTSIPESRAAISQLHAFFENHPAEKDENILLLFDENQALQFPESEFAKLAPKPSEDQRYWGKRVNSQEFQGAYFRLIPNIDSLENNAIFYQDFDNAIQAMNGYASAGSKEVQEGNRDTLWDWTCTQDSLALDISFWIKNNNGLRFGQDYIIGNHALLYLNGEEKHNFRIASSKIVNDDWSQVYFQGIEVKKGQVVQLVVRPKGHLPEEPLYIDDILVKPSNTHCKIDLGDNRFLIDNFIYLP